MALLSKDLLFGGLCALAKKLRRRHSSSSSCSSKKRPRSSSLSAPRPDADDFTSSSASPSSYNNNIRRVFDEYDGDSRISLHDLTRVVTAVGGGGLSATDAAAEAAAMMEVADVDRDGYIGFEEFQTLMTTSTTTLLTGSRDGSASVPLDAAAHHDDNHPQQHGSCTYSRSPCNPEQEAWAWAADEEDLRLAFAVYDHDGDGVITAKEIHAVLRRVMDNATITLADCRRMVQAVDGDGDGVVGFHDFVAVMMR